MNKNIIFEFLESIGIHVALLIAGLAGGLVSINRNKKTSVLSKVLIIISGGLIATYITPVFFMLFSFSDERAKYGVAFIIGYMGLKSIEIVINKINKNDESN